MQTRNGTSLVMASFLILACSTSAAQGVRLRPLSPIYVDGEGSSIRQPEGVGCGSGSEIVVADSGNSRLLRYEIADQIMRPAGTIVAPQLPQPIHAEIATSGQIYVLDGKRRKIARLDSSGVFQAYLEPTGAEGEIVPRSFKLDRDDNLWVLDIFSQRILVVDSEGVVLREIAFPEDHGVLSDLAIASGGRVFAIDSVRKTILSADKTESVLTALAEGLEGKADFPTSIVTDDAGNLYVGDKNGGSILVLGMDGSFRARQSGMGWKTGLLRYPSKLCIDATDHLFVADRSNNRIQVFAIVR